MKFRRTTLVTVVACLASAASLGPATVPASAAVPPHLVRSAHAQTTSPVRGRTATFRKPTGTGHLLVVLISERVQSGGYIAPSVSDSSGQTWQQLNRSTTDFNTVEMWYAPDAASVTSVTVRFLQPQVFAFQADDFGGVRRLNPVESSGPGSGTGTLIDSGGAGAKNADDLVVGLNAAFGVKQTMTVTSTDFVSRAEHVGEGAGTAAMLISGYVAAASPGASYDYTSTVPMTTDWGGMIVIFHHG